MKINRMPTTMVLLVSSWLIAISGVLGGGYLIIFKFNEINLFIKGFFILFGSILLATIVRTFGNIGQMFFDLRLDTQRLFASLSSDLKQRFDMLFQDNKETKESFSKDIFILNQDLKAQLQTQTAAISNDLKALAHSLTTLNQDLKAQLQTQTVAFTKNLEQLSASISNDLKALSEGLTVLNQDLKTQFQTQTTALSNDLKYQIQTLSENMQTLKNVFEQISCDSKDVNQNINQIKTFFEQIERHLDLKK